MDKLDIQIINLLQHDARRTNANIARIVKKSESTIKVHIDNLINAGIIKIKAAINPKKFGYHSNFDLKIKCNPGWHEEVAENLLKQKEIYYLAITTGEHDIVAEILAQSIPHYYKNISKILKELPGIRSTHSEFILKTKKIHYEWKLPFQFSAEEYDQRYTEITPNKQIDINIDKNGNATTLTLDEFDHNIIKLLQENGRRTNADIARILDKNESTVKNRINRMINNDLFKVVAILDPYQVGYQLNIIANIKVAKDCFESVSQRLLELEELVYMSFIAGGFDIQIELLLKNPDYALHFFSKKMSEISGISDIEKTVVLQNLKTPYDWKLPDS